MLDRIVRRVGDVIKASPPAVFSADGLARLASVNSYRSAAPFPHLVIDGLFRDDVLDAVLREWPAGEAANTEMHNDGTYVREKTATTWRTPFGPGTKTLFNALAEPQFLTALQNVTGMWGLMGDPYMIGGGLHSTAPGGRLAIHADFNRHPIFKLERRLNLLVYLNKPWTEANGGWLELWDRDMSRCVERILPVFNRAVLFSTTSTSFHGQPAAIEGMQTRKSVALYYFSNGRADEGVMPVSSDEHSTLWQSRPEVGY